jgi:hypothetical protein
VETYSHTRRAAFGRGLLVAVVVTTLSVWLWPEMSSVGTVIGGLLFWTEFIFVLGGVAAVYWPDEHDTPRVLMTFRRYAPLVVIATFLAGWTLLLPFARRLGPEFAAMILAIVIGVIGTYPSRRK